MATDSTDETCPKCGLEYIEKARISDFYSPQTETKVFCETEHYVYLHEV